MTDLAIVEDGVRIDIGEWRLDTDADIALDVAYARLNAAERARAATFVFDIDRERFIRGRGYLRARLGAWLGLPARDVPLATGADGKPFVEGHEVGFNLSHSADRAVLAISAGRDVGIDLELLDRADGLAGQIDGLAEMCMTSDEQAALIDLPQEARARRFLSYWTAKEARMKLTGEGMALDPRAISLELSDGAPVGYLRPTRLKADLRFIPLSTPDAICCLALRRGRDGAARAH